MTTVLACAKAGLMVCDSRITSGDIWVPGTKVHRIGGALYGLAGEVKGWHPWIKWHTGGRKGAKPKVSTNVWVICLRDGILYDCTEDGPDQVIERGFHAIGSGAAAALGAYMAGADAKRSVEIACLIDAASGGEIISHKLEAKP